MEYPKGIDYVCCTVVAFCKSRLDSFILFLYIFQKRQLLPESKFYNAVREKIKVLIYNLFPYN